MLAESQERPWRARGRAGGVRAGGGGGARWGGRGGWGTTAALYNKAQRFTLHHAVMRLRVSAVFPFITSRAATCRCRRALALMFVVVEAALSAMCGWQGPTTPAVHRHGVALQQMSMGHRIHQVRMSSKRKAKPAEAPSEVVVVDEAIQNILDDERCNVCLTHVNADFDSLAGTGRQFHTVGPTAVAAHRATIRLGLGRYPRPHVGYAPWLTWWGGVAGPGGEGGGIKAEAVRQSGGGREGERHSMAVCVAWSAGACALAKLWSIERPGLPTHVVMPRGVNPLVSRFLAYHKHLVRP